MLMHEKTCLIPILVFLSHITHMRNECYVYIVALQIMDTANDSNTDGQYTVANVFESLGKSFDGSRKQIYNDILWTLFLFYHENVC